MDRHAAVVLEGHRLIGFRSGDAGDRRATWPKPSTDGFSECAHVAW